MITILEKGTEAPGCWRFGISFNGEWAAKSAMNSMPDIDHSWYRGATVDGKGEAGRAMLYVEVDGAEADLQEVRTVVRNLFERMIISIIMRDEIRNSSVERLSDSLEAFDDYIGAISLPFGKYAGTKLCEIPLRYLDETICVMPPTFIVRMAIRFVDRAMREIACDTWHMGQSWDGKIPNATLNDHRQRATAWLQTEETS